VNGCLKGLFKLAGLALLALALLAAWLYRDPIMRGPDSVVLTPNEVASLIGGGVDWTVRKTFDSLRVELLNGAIAVHARLDTRRMPREALGPLAGVVRAEEPIRIAGPLTIAKPGTARWTVRELDIRGIPLPDAVLKRIARDVAGADSAAAVRVQIDPAVADVAVTPRGLVCYRRRRA